MQCLTDFYKLVCCISDAKFPTPYNFEFGHEGDRAQNHLLFESNFVRTSKYHWYDFFPSTSSP